MVQSFTLKLFIYCQKGRKAGTSYDAWSNKPLINELRRLFDGGDVIIVRFIEDLFFFKLWQVIKHLKDPTRFQVKTNEPLVGSAVLGRLVRKWPLRKPDGRFPFWGELSLCYLSKFGLDWNEALKTRSGGAGPSLRWVLGAARKVRVSSSSWGGGGGVSAVRPAPRASLKNQPITALNSHQPSLMSSRCDVFLLNLRNDAVIITTCHVLILRDESEMLMWSNWQVDPGEAAVIMAMSCHELVSWVAEHAGKIPPSGWWWCVCGGGG